MTDVDPQRFKMIEDKIAMIMSWADEHPEFDTEFVESLAYQFEDRGNLSNKQVEAMNSIIEKWAIDES